MGMMIPDFELDYRKRELDHYQELLERSQKDCSEPKEVTVPVVSVVKMLAENLFYRARIDHLMETILRHDFTIPQRIMMPNEVAWPKPAQQGPPQAPAAPETM
jgi:hypothetical protein